MTADTAWRLGRHLRTTPKFWMTLQVAHAMAKAAAETDCTTLAEADHS
jgi:plasmid maintenance system antidote protein VapI